MQKSHLKLRSFLIPQLGKSPLRSPLGMQQHPWGRQMGHWSQHCPALLPSSRGSMQHQGCKPGSHLHLPAAELSPKTWHSFSCRLLWQEEAFFEMSSIKACAHRSLYSQKAQLDLQQQGEINGVSAHQQITNPLTLRIRFILHPSKKSIKPF